MQLLPGFLYRRQRLATGLASRQQAALPGLLLQRLQLGSRQGLGLDQVRQQAQQPRPVGTLRQYTL